ncbi:MAG: hypothetical protein E7646_03475 [Ruminococcaceae bacterium]|nr:hypothetical protein [Oscillospiraceae bacterium]
MTIMELSFFGYIWWVLFIPLFVMFLLFKLIDVIVLKTMRMTKSAIKLIFADIFIIEAAHILTMVFTWGLFGVLLLAFYNAQTENFFRYAHLILLLIGILLFTIVSFLLIHRLERKKLIGCSENRAIHKRYLFTNIFWVGVSDMVYFVFFWFAWSKFDLLSGRDLEFRECLISVVVFLLIKIATAIFFVVKNKRKLDLPVENQ